MKILKGLFVLILFSACHHTPNKAVHGKQVEIAVQQTDSMLLNRPGAIIVRPSSRMINKMKKELPGDGDYDTVLDDNVFYMSDAEHFLDSLKTYKIERESEGVMKFKTLAGKTYTVKLDSAFFDIILFNGKDKPIHGDITDMPDDYKIYMKK
jgi:hypothetical protein